LLDGVLHKHVRNFLDKTDSLDHFEASLLFTLEEVLTNFEAQRVFLVQARHWGYHGIGKVVGVSDVLTPKGSPWLNIIPRTVADSPEERIACNDQANASSLRIPPD
jgi:hypothetical protein